MPQLENFVAWISIDDHPLQEYDVQYSEDLLTAVCWIASEDDKPFTIHWRDHARSQASMGRTFVDGVKCGVPKGINRRGYKRDPSKENDAACQREERQLVFSKVDYIGRHHSNIEYQLNKYIKPEEPYCGQAPIGEIRLEVSYIQKRGPTKLDEVATPHCTRRKPIHLVKPLGKTRVFVFKYRPFEILQSLGILPNGSKHCLVRDVDTGENQQETKITQCVADQKEIKTESGSQKFKKEEDMDIKIEEKRLKLEDDSMKTETKDWFSKLPLKTDAENKSIPKFEDAGDIIQAVGNSMRAATAKAVDIIDLSMDD